MAIPIASFSPQERLFDVDFVVEGEEQLSKGVFVKICDPMMGKGVGIGILSSHAERRRFKSEVRKRRKKKTFEPLNQQKQERGFFIEVTCSWKDKVGS